MEVRYCKVIQRLPVGFTAKALRAYAVVLLLTSCGRNAVFDDPSPPAESEGLHATIGRAGGELVGAHDTAFAGLRLSIPPGALSADTAIEITLADASTLPKTAVQCGPEFTIHPVGLRLATPASLTLPFDESIVDGQDRFDEDVKVWVATDGVWGQELQTDSGTGTVTVELPQLTRVSAGVTPPDPVDTIRFALHPNPPFLNCLSQYRGDDRRTPQVTVTVVRGDQTDALFVRGQNIRPNLGFTLFTVERSELDAVGNIDAGFHGFGLASYEADFDSSDKGTIRTAIRTILLDQVFEFDDDAKLAPKSPFQVGFWFNDPMDAVACGFDANKPTPFNEDHDAGPNAMISLPNAASGLGPLCTNADLSVTPAVCIPAPD